MIISRASILNLLGAGARWTVLGRDVSDEGSLSLGGVDRLEGATSSCNIPCEVLSEENARNLGPHLTGPALHDCSWKGARVGAGGSMSGSCVLMCNSVIYVVDGFQYQNWSLTASKCLG
jgi:hypothetical protein